MTLTPGVSFSNARAVRRARVRVRLIFAASILATAAHGLVVASPAAAAPPRVLAIRVGPDLEVNPVTKDYLNHQLDQAAQPDQSQNSHVQIAQSGVDPISFQFYYILRITHLP